MTRRRAVRRRGERMATSEQAAKDSADLEDLWPDPHGRGGEGGLVLGHAVDP
jgi:hypothetical protein